MRTHNLDDEIVEWRIKGEVFGRKSCSDLHKQARELLKVIFPTAQIKEEVPVPVRRGSTLFFDFYIPAHGLAVEVHGKQHYEFTPHFHQTRIAFAGAKKNDSNKAAWCALNDISLIILPHYEDNDEWTERIQRWRCGEDGTGDTSP